MESLTRRGFVSAAASAAVLAAAAPAVGIAEEGAAEEPVPDSGVMRVCISVNDLGKSLTFFTEQLEFTLVGSGILLEDVVGPLYGLQGGARYAMVKNDYQATVLQLIEFEGRSGACIRTEEDHGYDPGYFDVAVRCDDNYAVAKHLTKLGFTYYTEPYEYTAEWSGSTVSEAVLRGVDNVPTTMIMSVSEPRPEFPGLFKNITDIALVVSDMDEADAFWTGVLDMPKVYDEELEDGVVDPILGLPEGTHSRMAYYSGSNTAVIEALEFSVEGTPMAETAQPCNAGIFALAYVVDDLDATLQKAGEAGFNVHGDPVGSVLAVFGNVRSALVDGPDGMIAEIFELM
jgi:catechol 2,3-dioxygenase-like lactoylglutathione lyase family enzyme